MSLSITEASQLGRAAARVIAAEIALHEADAARKRAYDEAESASRDLVAAYDALRPLLTAGGAMVAGGHAFTLDGSGNVRRYPIKAIVRD